VRIMRTAWCNGRHFQLPGLDVAVEAPFLFSFASVVLMEPDVCAVIDEFRFGRVQCMQLSDDLERFSTDGGILSLVP
jgi:hypothetical protein